MPLVIFASPHLHHANHSPAIIICLFWLSVSYQTKNEFLTLSTSLLLSSSILLFLCRCWYLLQFCWILYAVYCGIMWSFEMIRISVFLTDCCFQEHDDCVLEVKDVQFEDCMMPITLCSCSWPQTEGLLDLVLVCPSPYVGKLKKIKK